MHKLVSFLALIYITVSSVAQAIPFSYELLPGEIYYLEFSMIQQTETEQSAAQGDASLDLRARVIMEIMDVDSSGAYAISCFYQKPELGFFSPQSRIAISSQDKAFGKFKNYLSVLDSNPFRIKISPQGELLEIYKLDSIIKTLFIQDNFDPGKDDFFVKTIDESFGEKAFRSLSNIVLNVYDEKSDKQGRKESFVTFNAAQIAITNNFYYTTLEDEKLRIQGVGVIHETIDSVEHEDFSLVNMTKGKQTYDFLFDASSGWIIDGMSKQKIQSLGVVRKHATLPEGLKIPSYTDTEYQFKGGRYEKEGKKK